MELGRTKRPQKNVARQSAGRIRKIWLLTHKSINQGHLRDNSSEWNKHLKMYSQARNIKTGNIRQLFLLYVKTK